MYYIMPQKVRYIWLLVCSYFFYLVQSTSFVALIVMSTVVTYCAGLLLDRTDDIRIKNCIVAVSVVINVGILAFIKYADFALEFFGSSRQFNLFLPIGISFYTFQALSYVIDCYRHKIPAEKNILRYALYVSFFPSLLSGPINRAQDLLPNLKCDNALNLNEVKCGLQKMLWGYFLKLVIAARLTIAVDTVYANADGYTSVGLITAAVFYLFMLYCDFEGYSQIAIGAARILGIKMKENFEQPFYSLSMGELWHRWHVSLSTWFREYLYFPLGGNRKGTFRKYINMMIIFIASGIWHGANMTFLIWGVLNGVFLIAGNVTIAARDNVANKISNLKYNNVRSFVRRIGVYLLYAFTMIFFANDSVSNAIVVIRGIFTKISIMALANGELFNLGLGRVNLIFSVIMVLFVLVVDYYCDKNKCDFSSLMTRVPTLYRWVLYLSLVIFIMFSANLSGKEFIYATM